MIINKEQNSILELAVRNNSIPPIKGEITIGKIRWRGLRLINKKTTIDMLNQYDEIWIEQRGKRISPIIRNEYHAEISLNKDE